MIMSSSSASHPVALVTGASGAIGQAIAKQLAQKGFALYLICRNSEKAKGVIQFIKKITRNNNVHALIADISRRSSIFSLAENWSQPVKILINNAAIAPKQREETAEGIERQWATNVLGQLWMSETFSKWMSKEEEPRIVNVASYWAGDLDLEDLEFKQRPYNNDLAYRQSKQANRMLTFALASRLRERGITINACHPGDVHSNLSHSLGFGGHETPDQGAATPVWLATEESLKNKTGKYFEHQQEMHCPFMRDIKSCEKLYEICQQYGG